MGSREGLVRMKRHYVGTDSLRASQGVDIIV
jgi:hypothetical protein